MGDASLRPCQVGDVPTRYTVAGDLEFVPVAHASGDPHRASPRPDHDGIAVHELKPHERAFEEKLVEIDLLQDLISPFYHHISVASLPPVHSPGPAQVVEQGVGRHPGKTAGGLHIARDVDDHRAGTFQVGVNIDILGEHGAHRATYPGGQIAVSDPHHANGTDVGHEDVSLGVHDDDVGVIDRPPHSKRNVVPGPHQVIGIQPVLAFPLESAIEELLSEGADAPFLAHRNRSARTHPAASRPGLGARVGRMHGDEGAGRRQDERDADSKGMHQHSHNPMWS